MTGSYHESRNDKEEVDEVKVNDHHTQSEHSAGKEIEYNEPGDIFLGKDDVIERCYILYIVQVLTST